MHPEIVVEPTCHYVALLGNVNGERWRSVLLNKMGGGASSKKKSVEALRQHRNEEKGGRVLNKIEWNVAAHGPDPDEVELADIIACLSEYYKRHEPSKRRRVCGEVRRFAFLLCGNKKVD